MKQTLPGSIIVLDRYTIPPTWSALFCIQASIECETMMRIFFNGEISFMKMVPDYDGNFYE